MHADPSTPDDARGAADGADEARSAPKAPEEAPEIQVAPVEETAAAQAQDDAARAAAAEAGAAGRDAAAARAAADDAQEAADDAQESATVAAVAATEAEAPAVVDDPAEADVDPEGLADAEDAATQDADEASSPAPKPEETIGATGMTLEQLSAYFDRGRTPRIARVEDDAEARALLDSMERLGRLATSMSQEDARSAGEIDEEWLEGVLSVIRSEVKAGRDLLIEDTDERTSTTITEGALREIARTAGDGIDGVLVGRVRLSEDAGVLDVRMTIGVRYGTPLRPRAEEVREAAYRALASHAPMTVRTIDVVIDDVLQGGGR